MSDEWEDEVRSLRRRQWILGEGAARGCAAALLMLAILAVFVVLAMVGADWQECTARGGQYVQGVLWYQCVFPAAP